MSPLCSVGLFVGLSYLVIFSTKVGKHCVVLAGGNKVANAKIIQAQRLNIQNIVYIRIIFKEVTGIPDLYLISSITSLSKV